MRKIHNWMISKTQQSLRIRKRITLVGIQLYIIKNEKKKKKNIIYLFILFF